MRDVDERIAAVQGRVRRMKRKNDRVAVGALAACMVLACVGLVGMPVANGQAATSHDGSSLFGATSLFGPSIGGYVLVAIITAVVVALVTALFVMRRRSGGEKNGTQETMTDYIGDSDSRG